MSRRRFLQQTLTGLPILLLGPTLTAGCKKEQPLPPNGKTVLVIGAGMAGLAAAERLQFYGGAVTCMM